MVKNLETHVPTGKTQQQIGRTGKVPVWKTDLIGSIMWC